MTEFVVELRGVAKTFGRRVALEGVDLSIPRGRVAAVVGSNGAGKSTLLRIVSGILRPDRGLVEVVGRRRPDADDELLTRVAYLDQDRPLYRSFRVAEMLRAAASCNPRWNEEVARGHLASLGIALDTRISQLSGGQHAQVALALCLAREPEVLVLDEPAAALDPAARADVLAMLMQRVADSATTVLLSTHALGDVVAICDYLVVVAHGRVVLADELDFVLHAHRVARVPREHAAWPEGVTVIEERRAERETVALVRLELPVDDEGFGVEPPTLDEIVLAYMRRLDTRVSS